MNHMPRTTIIHPAEPFDAERHNIHSLNCGNDFVENIICWRAGKCVDPNHAEFVFTAPQRYGTKAHVIAYASGAIVNEDSDSKKPLDAPRIDIEVVAVDQQYQGMGLGRVVSAHVIDALYAQAKMPVIEVRAIDAIGSHSAQLWYPRGFRNVEDTTHMRLMVCADEIQTIRAWPLTLRPGFCVAKLYPNNDKGSAMETGSGGREHAGLLLG